MPSVDDITYSKMDFRMPGMLLPSSSECLLS